MSRAVTAIYDEIEDRLSPGSRCVDMSVELVEQAKLRSGKIANTGRSQVYGGKYDRLSGRIIGPADDLVTVRLLPSQFEAATATNDIIENSGGRGSGKTMTAIAFAMRGVCEYPRTKALALSATTKGSETLFADMRATIPVRWLLPGRSGVRQSVGRARLCFRNSALIDFWSIRANNRGTNLQWLVYDESGFMTDDEILDEWYTLRASSDIRALCALTPSALAWRRHAKAVADPKTLAIVSKGTDNFFANLGVYTRNPVYEVVDGRPAVGDAEGYDAERFLVEIEAAWDVVEKWMKLERRPIVYGLDRGTHLLARTPDTWRYDVTRAVASRSPFKRGWRYIAGIDWAHTNENTAVVYRCLARDSRSADPRSCAWLAVDILDAAGTADVLLGKMNAAGYSPRNTLLVPDASGGWRRPHEPRAPHDLARDMGYAIWAPPQNPPIQDRYDALNLLVSPAMGPPRWFALAPKAEPLVGALEKCVLKPNGNADKHWVQIGDCRLDPTGPLDACSYPIHRFTPASPRAQQSGVRGFTASRL